MNISATTPISGMNAASVRMDSAANNVAAANAGASDFQSRRTEQAETAAARPAQQAAATYEPGAGTQVYDAGSDRPDLARDTTDMAAVRNSYTANAEVVAAQNEMTQTSIDLVG